MDNKDIIIYALGYIVIGTLGYVSGLIRGYKDALPKRDERGRFIKED